MTQLYRLAGRSVEVRSMHPDVHELCRDYRAGGVPDLVVSTAPSDVEFERSKSAREDGLAGVPTRWLSDGYLETLAVCRRVAERMPEYDTFLFHGSCVAVDGAGYLFTARSGTGKSTHARLWRELLGGRAAMVNDDKPLVRVNGGGAVAYGTPWDGKHRLSSNVAVPLRAICVLERAGENRIVPISKSEALPTLVQQAYRPADPVAMARTLALIDRLGVRLYRLSCNMDVSAAELSYNAMKD